MARFCRAFEIVLLFIGALIFLLFACLVIWINYQLTVAQRNNTLGSNQCLYHLVQALSVMVLLTYIIWAASNAMICWNFHIASMLSDIGGLSMCVQYVVLGLVYYYRLIYIFKGTMFEVSGCTKKTLYAIYVVANCAVVPYIAISFTPLYYTIWGSIIMAAMLSGGVLWFTVVLGFKKYESYYMKICQKCHVKCINMCSKMVSGTDKTTIQN
eukprot:843498_1